MISTDRTLAKATIAVGVLLLVIALAILLPLLFDVTWWLYEDGSFTITGCLPWAICFGG